MRRTGMLLCLFILLSFSLTVQAEVPKLINYQGKLTTAEGGCVDTSVQMTFSIYPDSISIDPLWTEIQPSVRVKEGVFNVLLGSVDSIPGSVFTGGIRYLGVKVEDDQEMTPRKAIVSVGYSFRSDLSDTAQYALSAPPDDDWDTDTSGLNIYRFTGSVGIGGLAPPDAKLYVKTDSLVGTYAVYAEGGKPVRGVSTALEGTGISGEGGHAGVAGNGYIGILGQGFWGGWFEGKGYFSGNVGIGTTEPDENLEVDGNAHITGDLTVDGSINSISLKVYDSGWFEVSQAQTYPLTHNLGTTKVITELWFSTSSDGSSAVRVSTMERSSDAGAGASLHDLTTTHISVSSGLSAVAGKYSGGWLHYYTSGYYRLILLALE